MTLAQRRGTLANETAIVSIGGWRAEEKKMRRKKERNERSTDVTGNLVNVDYRGCCVQSVLPASLLLSPPQPNRPANDINLTSYCTARDRNVNPPLGRARDDRLTSTMAGARRGYN